MSEVSNDGEQQEGNKRKGNLASTVDTVGLGLFLIWIGIAFWLDLAGWGLIGAGVITLGDQALRKCLRIKVEGSWVFVGALLVLAGVGKFGPEFPLAPILLIVAGIAILLSLLRSKPK